VIRLVRVVGIATVQDVGRRGWAWAGVPPGGALVPERLARANARVGNPPDAPAIELLGALGWTATVATATADQPFPPGAHALSPAPALRYLAVAGGIDAPWQLGGRGTSWQAGIGRPLVAGDAFGVCGPPGPLGPLPPERAPGPLRLWRGPDADGWSGADALVDTEWRVGGASDRVGLRLDGPPLPPLPADRPSAPMVRGAVQLPPSGLPILLGPDHPTTGGYPVVAVVQRADWGGAGDLRPGDPVVLRWR
jgi:allophanate hydrolase subunit 2